jgi:hypothetical protein
MRFLRHIGVQRRAAQSEFYNRSDLFWEQESGEKEIRFFHFKSSGCLLADKRCGQLDFRQRLEQIREKAFCAKWTWEKCYICISSFDCGQMVIIY